MFFQTAFSYLFSLIFFVFSFSIHAQTYEQRGVGGGGAMSGFSMSPYSDLWFVGTDMGHIYRSTDRGASWRAVDHFQARFSSDLPNASYLGFNPDVNIVFHAFEGCTPKRSTDGGLTWNSITSLENLLPTGGYNFSDCKNDANKNRIRYWLSDSFDENIVFAAGGDGLYRSSDKGINWSAVPGVSGESTGTFFDYSTTPHTVYHANQDTIFRSLDAGLTFSVYHTAAIRSFTGGRDTDGLTLAFLERDDTDCPGGDIDENCGNVHVEMNNAGFSETGQIGGDWLRMAENNSQIMYVTGSRNWNTGTGTKIWVSEDAGQNFTLRLQQLLLSPLPYHPWPSEFLEWSAVGLDVGYDDGGYRSFAVNQRNAAEAGGTGNYFLHVSRDNGLHWEAPFTEYMDSGPRTADKKWRSTGIEPTSAWHVEFHPNNPQIAYVGYADIGGLCSEDGGNTWRIVQTDYNSTYDHAFDPADDNVVYAAVSSKHDFPYNWYGNYDFTNPGGIYKSLDRGRNWTRLTPATGEFNTLFLSVEYDAVNGILYGGTQGRGIAKSTDGGATWSWMNDGLGSAPKIISQIEIHPSNQDLYIVMAGDRPDFSNINETGIYKLSSGNTTWEHLRGTVHPPGTDGVNFIGPLWKYPVHFAVDWRNPDKMWMTDIRNYGSYKAAGIWQTTDGGDNWYRKKEAANPHRVTLDPCDAQTVYVNGMGGGEDVPFSSGSMYSTDDGATWQYNVNLPMHYNLSSLSIDPNNPDKVFYTSFGGGMWYGDKPQSNPVSCGLAVVLPVELAEFNSSCRAGKTYLSWTTSSEVNNQSFTPERKLKGDFETTWEELETIAAKGAGVWYHFIDDSAKGTAFYRLKQTDRDGQYSYSEVIKSDCATEEDEYRIFPNPASGGSVFIKFTHEAVGLLTLSDISGKVILEKYLNFEQDVELDNLSPGLYLVRFGKKVKKLIVN